MARGQSPRLLWIGCSGSRVPPNVITETGPGEIFVHMDIANMVGNTDLNLLSVLQYAVEILRISHIIVCGHYGCGEVFGSMTDKHFGLIDNWLCHIRDVYRLHQTELDAISNEAERVKRRIEINTIEQVRNLNRTSIIRDAWKKGSLPSLHAWIYDVESGFIKEILRGMIIKKPEEELKTKFKRLK